jgi:CubicO group peptidase (beta-lactamase class C family)
MIRAAAALLTLLALPTLSLGGESDSGATSPAATLFDPGDVESFVDGVMTDQLRTANIAGAVVAIVAGGRVLLAKGYGYGDVEAHKPADAQATLFRPGSISTLLVSANLVFLGFLASRVC